MIKTLLRTLLILIILCISIGAFLLTPMGLRFSVDIASKILPGKLTYQKISGVAVGPITIDQLEYQNEDTTISIGKLYFNWQPLNLFKRHLHIETLNIDSLRYISKTKIIPDKLNKKNIQKWITYFSSIFDHSSFIKKTSIDHATVNHFELVDPRSKIETEKTQLAWHIEKSKWDVQLTLLTEKPILFQSRFSLTGNASHYQFHFLATGKQTNWELIGSGDENTLSLSTPKYLFLNGTLDANFAINYKPALHWSGQLNAANINFGLLNKDFINVQSVDIHTQGSCSPSLITNTSANIVTSNGQIKLNAAFNKIWHVNWLLNFNHLNYIFSHQKGKIVSHGNVDGDFSNPHFSIYFQEIIHSLYGKIKAATINLSGDLKQHVLKANLNFPHRKMNINIIGSFNNEEWHGTLNQFTIRLTKTHHFYLEKPVSLSATADKATLSEFCLTSKTEGHICAQGQWQDKKLSGFLEMDIVRFAWIHAFIKKLHIEQGRMIAHLKLVGTLEKPEITGSVDLTRSVIPFPEVNITLRNVTAKIVSDTQKLNFEIQAFSKNRPIYLKGDVDLSQPDFLANATLTSNNALIMNTDQYVFYATSNLTAKIKNDDVYIGGSLTIPSGKIKPNDFQITTTLPDNDIVYTGVDKPKSTPFWNIFVNTKVNITNHVILHSAGINARLGGAVTITQKPGHDALGTGEIDVRQGTYVVYGRTLTIMRGSSLIFNNSLLNNPQLNVKTEKVISNLGDNMDSSNFADRKLIVGIELHGSVKEPKIQFFSNRSKLSQTGILSYLLLGYDTGTTDAPGNTELLLRGLAAIDITSQGLLGKENIASEIQSGLGLSEMGVESDTTSDALGNPLNRQSAFVIGKHLTPRLYVRYSIGIYNTGLVNPIDVFELRYLLTKNWMLQGDSSTLGNGADVLYTIQKN